MKTSGVVPEPSIATTIPQRPAFETPRLCNHWVEGTHSGPSQQRVLAYHVGQVHGINVGPAFLDEKLNHTRFDHMIHIPVA
jgi:hypothetical protein